MVGAHFSPHSTNSMASNGNHNKYAPPHQAYATPNSTLSTVLPYGGGGNGPAPPSGYPNININSNHYPPSPSGYPPAAAAQPYSTPPAAAAYPFQNPQSISYPPSNNNINYAYPPIPSAPPSNCFSQLTPPPATYPPPPPSYSSGYPTSVYPAAPYQPQGTYPPAPGGVGVYPPPPSAGNVYPPRPY